VETEGPGRAAGNMTFSSEEEEKFRRMASDPEIYERIAKSIAPSIFGSTDIKKAIACLLFGGSRKRMPDGLTRYRYRSVSLLVPVPVTNDVHSL
jgi:DNA replication licensing factor MCM5